MVFHCYRSFCTADLLFEKLRQRYNVPQPPSILFMQESEWRDPVENAVLAFLAAWLEVNYSDISKRLLSEIKEWLAPLRDCQQKEKVKQVIETKHNAAMDARRAIRIKPQLDITDGTILNPEEMKALVFSKFDAEQIARQLCLIDFNLYSAIRPSELIDTSWSKRSTRHRCANALAMIKRFNDVSEWVSTSIVSEEKIKDRVKLFVTFVKIAEKLRELCNFSCMLAITSGLTSSAVHRLLHTKKEVPKATLTTLYDLVQLMSPDSSYRNYRLALEELQMHPDRQAIPYLGVYLTDLTFLDQGNPDFFQSLINVHKRCLSLSVIKQALQHQKNPYPIQLHEKLFAYLNDLFILDESQAYSLSLKREPRNCDRSQII
jgi:hypothetical protein